MSSLAYLHQTNILYSRLSARYNADIEEADVIAVQSSHNPLKSFQDFIAPTAQHLRTLFLPYKGRKRSFIMRQYRDKQARLKAYSRTLLSNIRRMI
jgi:hypothetical protein